MALRLRARNRTECSLPFELSANRYRFLPSQEKGRWRIVLLCFSSRLDASRSHLFIRIGEPPACVLDTAELTYSFLKLSKSELSHACHLIIFQSQNFHKFVRNIKKCSFFVPKEFPCLQIRTTVNRELSAPVLDTILWVAYCSMPKRCKFHTGVQLAPTDRDCSILFAKIVLKPENKPRPCKVICFWFIDRFLVPYEPIILFFIFIRFSSSAPFKLTKETGLIIIRTSLSISVNREHICIQCSEKRPLRVLLREALVLSSFFWV